MSALTRRHAIDACHSVGPAVEPSSRVLLRNSPSSVSQSVVSLVRWRRRSVADDHWRTMNIHRLDATLWLATSCKLQYYANDSCKPCASLAGLLLSFNFYRSCDIGLNVEQQPSPDIAFIDRSDNLVVDGTVK